MKVNDVKFANAGLRPQPKLSCQDVPA